MDKYEDLVKRLDVAFDILRRTGHLGYADAVYDAAAILRTLQTERDQDRRDAERYRWLRSNCDGGPPWAETDNAWFDGEELDTAIDAARLQEQREP